MTTARDHIYGLTVNRARELLSYDPLTGLFHWRIRRSNRVKAGDVAGNLCRRGYVDIRIDGRNYKAHRLAWFYVHGEWPSAYLDHRNRVRNDNRWDNLREATDAQNKANVALIRTNTSGVRGVFMSRGKYRAQVKIHSQCQHLGIFSTLEEAAGAVAAARRKAFGDFATG